MATPRKSPSRTKPSSKAGSPSTKSRSTAKSPAKKPAAWLALTWITNKMINKYEIQKYQIDANRTSAFSDAELVKAFPYLPDSMKAIENADTIPTSNIPEFFQLNDAMNVEFNKALIGGQDAKTACANVQTQWEAMLRKAGHLT